MPKIKSKIDPSSEKYHSNFSYHKSVLDELISLIEKIKLMGPIKRKKSIRKKEADCCERINLLKDPDSNSLEFSELAGYNVYDSQVPLS